MCQNVFLQQAELDFIFFVRKTSKLSFNDIANLANGFNRYKAQLETFNHRKLQLNNKREVLNTKIKEYLKSNRFY